MPKFFDQIKADQGSKQTQNLPKNKKTTTQNLPEQKKTTTQILPEKKILHKFSPKKKKKLLHLYYTLP